MNIDKFKNNFGVYVSLTLMGAGVGLFIGYYIESRRQEQALEEIPPIDDIKIGVSRSIETDNGDPVDISNEIILDELLEADVEVGLDDESYEAILLSQIDDVEGYTNYHDISSDNLDPDQIVLDDEVIATRYQLRDLESKDDTDECVKLFIQPKKRKFHMDLGSGMTAPVTKANVFGPDDSEIIDMMVDLFKQDPGYICGITDTESDRHWVVVILPED